MFFVNKTFDFIRKKLILICYKFKIIDFYYIYKVISNGSLILIRREVFDMEKKDPKKSPKETNGPVVKTGPTAGNNRRDRKSVV